MIQEIIENPETLVSALIFASIFFAGPRWRLNLETKKGYRRIVSFSAGIAIAYVFMNFLPELSEASALFVEQTHHLSLISPEHRVYGASLLGFVLFYGIEYIAWPTSRQPGSAGGGSNGEDKICRYHRRLLPVCRAHLLSSGAQP